MTDILILGNPNSGKTLLFNRLTGLRQKVANFPGVTVEIRRGESDGLAYQDYPGVYSLKPLTVDERVAVDGFRRALASPTTRGILCVLDATRLERSLYLLLQLLPIAKRAKCPVVAAVNVVDELVGSGSKVDMAGLANALGCPVLGISAKKGMGLEALRLMLRELPIRDDVPTLESLDFGALNSGEQILDLKARAHRIAKDCGPSSDVLLKSQQSLDRFFLSTWAGPVVFTLLMLMLFQAIFSWATPFTDLIDGGVVALGEWTAGLAGEGMLADFIRDAVFAGIGSFVVFAPQIFILFLVIGVLEDTGYLARAAVILHRPLSWFGLSGRSFVPLLSGHACAIPAIMATRTIESPRKRFLTILAAPFVSCSARLPVYALLVGGFVPATTILGGFIGLQGLAFFALFALGIVTALLVTAVLDRVLSRRAQSTLGDAPFVIELPSYRVPGWRPIVLNAASKTWGFIRNAGWVLFSVTVVIWILGYFPNGSGHLDTSYLGRLGQWIEPVFAPMGMDWKIGVGVLTSFLAREVFVGTLGTLYGIESVEDDTSSLTEKLQASGMGLPGAAALLVFYSLAMQCVSTLAVIRKETGSARLPVYVFIGMTILAYVAAMAAFALFKSLA